MNSISNKKVFILFSIVSFTLSFNFCAFAQSSEPDSISKSIKNQRVVSVIAIETGAYLAGLSYLRYVWYKDHERVPFHFYDDSKGYLQMDKAGHAYSAYYQSLATYRALEWAGSDKKHALLYSGLSGFMFQTPIEVFDGLYEGWGFSWSDIAANTLGSLLFVGQEAYFNKQIVSMKFSYYPSGYPKYHSILGETPIESFFYDYNAHSHWLSVNLRSLSSYEKIPPWLNVAFGYSANGMIKEFENPKFYKGKPFPHLERYRQYYLSLDVDWTKIKTDRRWLRNLFRTMNLIKVPFPAIEYNSLKEVKFHFIYF